MTYREDIESVLAGSRELATFERDKNPSEYDAAVYLARSNGLLVSTHDGIGESGKHTLFAAVADNLRALRGYLELIAERDNTPRYLFQTRLGELLGYDRATIRDWVRHTPESRNCRCTLCGRPESGATVNRGDA